ncbi:hypothetical protein [Nocardiopsis algeriensis]|uniref:Uncharacterized protein n=1 Tax=Nocardiopsis algeriensis TaxID=1478215 RepID=A0A841ITT6_9ACTN|nr:hypothetical protein [Nocardiopsis algeriensis]
MEDNAPRFSVSVMTHPRRAGEARKVLDALGLPGARLAVDPDPGGPPSSLRAAAVAFSHAELHEGTHHLVLQDDVILCADFTASVCDALRRYPGAALAFFVEWGSRTACLARWAAFAGVGAVPVVNPYMPTPALALPRDIAVDMGRHMACAEGRSDDRAALAFLRGRGVRTLAAVPNLVEHRELPSLKGNGDHGVRRATCFASGGARFDGRVLDLPPLLPFLRWNLGKAVLIDTANDVPEAHRPLLEVLLKWGAEEGELRRGCADRLGGGSGPLLELWLTAVAFGALQEMYRPGSVAVLRERREEPLVRGSLDTFAPGALRRFRPLSTLTGTADAVLAAMEYGAELRPSPA